LSSVIQGLSRRLVIRVTTTSTLGRDVVELRGRIKGQHGATAVAAKGVVLVTARL